MPYSVRDIIDFTTSVADHANVFANTAARHARAHSLASVADHGDVEGTPADGDTLVYSAGKWRPQAAGVGASDLFLLMGG